MLFRSFWHPPYWDIVTYSDVMYKAAEVQKNYGYDPRQYDLSRIPDWEGFVGKMNYAMMKQFTALEKGGRMAVLMGDIKKKGVLYSMLSEIIKPGTLENIIIKAQHNCFSGKERVIIVGEKRALCIAVKRTDTEKRGTCLARRLQELL